MNPQVEAAFIAGIVSLISLGGTVAQRSRPANVSGLRPGDEYRYRITGPLGQL